MWIICKADDSHEMSSYFLWKMKTKIKMSSAAVLISTLSVKNDAILILSSLQCKMSALFSRLIVTTLLENSAADKLIFFPDNRVWHFMQISARKKCQPFFFFGKKKREKKKAISKYLLLKFLPSMLSGKCFFCVWRWCWIIIKFMH